MEPFDIETSPLRSSAGADAVPHPLLIEASAGSGKTWALAHLAVRFLLEEDVAAGEMLLVTFTRDAARTLRGRVREHLAEVLDFLERSDRNDLTPQDWQRYYAGFDAGRQRACLERGRRSLGELDSLHAQTIDSFASSCVDVGPRTISEGARQWRQACNEVIADVALNRSDDFQLLIDHSTIETLEAVAKSLYEAGARFVDGHLQTPSTLRILPDDEEPERNGDVRRRAAGCQRDVAGAIIGRFDELLAQSAATTFSELLVGLARRLEGPGSHAFVNELRQGFHVVMIDEFQDTSPLQWHIFRRLFLDAPDTRLVLVGDPKQAIYLFRSGSVETFAAARMLCVARGVPVSTRRYNYRSSPALLAGVNQLFLDSDFHYDLDTRRDEQAITFTPALSPSDPGYTAVSDILTGELAPMHLRTGPKDDRAVAHETVDYATRLHREGVGYSAIAVLCRTRRQCRTVQRAFMRRGVPSTTSADEDVYQSDAAQQLRLLLGALADPDEAAYTEVLRATWFRDGAGPGVEPGQFVFQLIDEFTREGVAALVRFLRSEHVLATVLALRDAERHATDLAHLAEVMARDCQAVRALALVLDWLDNTASVGDVDEAAEARRLETESDAVRIMTVHKAKGLEFDAVLVAFLDQPFPTMGSRYGRHSIRRWVDGDRVVIDAGSGTQWGADAARRDQMTIAAEAGEQRRLAYVAMTRAKQYLVAWCALSAKQPLQGEFGRLLYDRELVDGGGSRARNRLVPEVEALFVKRKSTQRTPVESNAIGDPVGALRDLWHDVASVEVHAIGTAIAPPSAPTFDEAPTTRLTFEHAEAPQLTWQRRRWSYTDLARSLRDRPLADEPDDEVATVGGFDEPVIDRAHDDTSDDEVAAGVRAVFGSLAGARLGAAVHSVLERLVGRDVEVDRRAVLVEALRDEGFPASEIETSYRAIDASLDQILGRSLDPLLDARPLDSLRSLEVAKEMRFVLALGEQERADRLAAMARAVREHDLSSGGRGLFAEYFESLAHVPEGLNQGYLVGSLDLVVRRSDGRYLVIDYKTDQLAGSARPFAESRLVDSMVHEHYPLQAMLYSVALHRHLRHAIADYEPARHLGGVAYYYLRVVGDPTAVPGDGVVTWGVTPDAVAHASDALAGLA